MNALIQHYIYVRVNAFIYNSEDFPGSYHVTGYVLMRSWEEINKRKQKDKTKWIQHATTHMTVELVLFNLSTHATSKTHQKRSQLESPIL